MDFIIFKEFQSIVDVLINILIENGSKINQKCFKIYQKSIKIQNFNQELVDFSWNSTLC